MPPWYLAGMSSNTLFVSNFPFTTTEAELRSTFETYSNVLNVRIITDRQTGRSRGYAFVELEEPTALQRAIEQLNESTYRGRRLVVNEAKGKPATGGRGERNTAARPPFRHRIVVEWHEDAHAYDAEVPALGVHGAGETPERAMRDAIRHAEERTVEEHTAEDDAPRLTSQAF